jgi:hypothetical protein
MKKFLIALFGLFLSLTAAPAAAQTFQFTITETTGGGSSFFASFQLTGSPNFQTGPSTFDANGNLVSQGFIEFTNVLVTFANGSTVTVDAVAFFDTPDGGLTFFDNNAFLFSSQSQFDEQTFERGAGGSFSNFTEFSGFSLLGDDPDGSGPADFSDKTFSLSISQVQTVPEPDTWAMMILGFGLAGYSLRRRRRGDSAIDARRELQPAF